MAEDIIITPGSGQIDFQDTGNTSTILVVSSGALKWNRSGTTYLEWNPSSPTFRVGPADLRLTTKIVNNALDPLIDSTGWKGNPEPQGAQGATGTQGNVGSVGAQGTIGGQGALGPTGLTGATGAQGAVG